MFSWSIHVVSDSSKLSLIVPMHYMMLVVLSISVLVVLTLTMKAGHGWRNLLILACVAMAYGFLSYSSELILDRQSDRATLREFEFFHWRTQVFPLERIDNVYVGTGSTTSQMMVRFTDGAATPITFLDQNGGKEQAAYAVNQFLRANR